MSKFRIHGEPARAEEHADWQERRDVANANVDADPRRQWYTHKPQPWERDRGEAFLIEAGNADGFVDAKLGRPMSAALRFVEASWHYENGRHWPAYSAAYFAAWRKQNKEAA